jgi:nucleotide-binding universal stress UspA family protein
MVVVTAVDRSDDAGAVIKEAEKLAMALEEPLHIVHVMTRSEFTDVQRASTEESGTAVDMDTIADLAAEYAEESVSGIDLSYKSVGLVGDAASKLVQYADEQNASYLVIGNRKRSPAGKAIFGSVSQSVILNSKNPVVSVVRREK